MIKLPRQIYLTGPNSDKKFFWLSKVTPSHEIFRKISFVVKPFKRGWNRGCWNFQCPFFVESPLFFFYYRALPNILDYAWLINKSFNCMVKFTALIFLLQRLWIIHLHVNPKCCSSYNYCQTKTDFLFTSFFSFFEGMT